MNEQAQGSLCLGSYHTILSLTHTPSSPDAPKDAADGKEDHHAADSDGPTAKRARMRRHGSIGRAPDVVDYELVACAEQADMAPVLVALALEAGITIRYHASTWDKFEDGTDNIVVGGFSPQNFMRNSHVIFLASFSTNDTILSQYHALIMLSEAFVESLTVVLPYYPHGTMERVIREGQIATANTIARMFSNLPMCGKPTRVSVDDLCVVCVCVCVCV